FMVVSEGISMPLNCFIFKSEATFVRLLLTFSVALMVPAPRWVISICSTKSKQLLSVRHPRMSNAPKYFFIVIFPDVKIEISYYVKIPRNRDFYIVYYVLKTSYAKIS